MFLCLSFCHKSKVEILINSSVWVHEWKRKNKSFIFFLVLPFIYYTVTQNMGWHDTHDIQVRWECHENCLYFLQTKLLPAQYIIILNHIHTLIIGGTDVESKLILLRKLFLCPSSTDNLFSFLLPLEYVKRQIPLYATTLTVFKK